MEEEKIEIKELKLSEGFLNQRTLEHSQQKEKKEVKGDVEEFESVLIRVISLD